jgi:hypothetical protein
MPAEGLAMSRSLLKQPSAWAPVAMSLAALALVLGHAAIYGTVREADEGTAAHLYQLLMVTQVPVIGFFAIKWLPRAPWEAVRVLALQASAIVAAFAALYVLESGGVR